MPLPYLSNAAALSVVSARPASSRSGSAQGRKAVRKVERSTDQKRLQNFIDVQRNEDTELSKLAAKIMRIDDIPGAGSVTCCGTKPIYGRQVQLRQNTVTGRASYGALFRCSNVWACATCSRAIANTRREEANKALAAARAEGLSVFLMTLTFRHKAGMDLKAMLQSMSKARSRLSERREYRALDLVGTITATEITCGGRNGHHPHLHVCVFMKGDQASNLRALKALAPVWLRCLKAMGLEGGKAAFDVRDGSAAGEYIAKGWGAAEELTLASQKTPKVAGSRTPRELLADAARGDKRAVRLWAEYARAFHGKRQLVWSRGLKDRFKIRETTDAEAAEAEAKAAETIVVRTFNATEWEVVRDRKNAMLRAVERGANLMRAMSGPTDRQRWERYTFRDVERFSHDG